MCGIVGYLGHQEAWPIIFKGLQRLEYRGYDSAGIAIVTTSSQLEVHKSMGKVKGLSSPHGESTPVGQLGLGHTFCRSEFTQIPDMVSTQVACGWEHVVAIDEQCRLWGWGSNEWRQLSPLTISQVVTPTILREDTVATFVGLSNTLALTTDNQVMACGLSSDSQLGNGAPSDQTHWTVSTITPDMMRVADRIISRVKSARSAKVNS